MFVAWILNFQVNLRKIISLEPHMKLESQNMHFIHAKIIRRRRKIVEKTAIICKVAFLHLQKKKKLNFFENLNF